MNRTTHGGIGYGTSHPPTRSHGTPDLAAAPVLLPHLWRDHVGRLSSLAHDHHSGGGPRSPPADAPLSHAGLARLSSPRPPCTRRAPRPSHARIGPRRDRGHGAVALRCPP